MDVPRDQVVAFALYTHDRGVLKLTAQLYPLKPGEPREARLEFQRDGEWTEAAQGAGAVSRLERAFPRRELGRHAGRAVSRAARRAGDVRGPRSAAIRATRT